MSKTIALYARVSSDQQAREGTIESQLDTLRDYARNHGYKVEEDLIFVDEGRSGATLERPALDALRDKAAKGQINIVLVLTPDRLARKQTHQIILMEEFKRMRVKFLFTSHPIGTTAEDRLLLQILGGIAEYEREQTLERSRRGKLHKAKQGKVSVLSGAPFGFIYSPKTDTTDARYIIHPTESLIVKKIFDLFVGEQKNINSIVHQLNDEHILPRRGKWWSKSSVHGVLTNPACMGKAAYRKTQRVSRERPTKQAFDRFFYSKDPKGSRKRRPTSEQIFIEVPVIISPQIYNQAQTQLQKNKQLARRNTKYQYLLRSLIRCQICGYAMYGRTFIRNQRKTSYYRCVGQDGQVFPDHTRRCPSHPIRTEVIDEQVWKQVQRLLESPEVVFQEYLERVQKKHQRPFALTSLLNQKKSAIQHQNRQKERLLDLYQAGIIQLDDISPRLDRIRHQIKQLETEYQMLEREQQEEAYYWRLIGQFEEFSKQWTTSLSHLTFDEKRAIIELLISEVRVDVQAQQLIINHTLPQAPSGGQLRPDHVHGSPK